MKDQIKEEELTLDDERVQEAFINQELGRERALERVEKMIDELVPPLQLETCCFRNIFEFKKKLIAQIKKEKEK